MARTQTEHAWIVRHSREYRTEHSRTEIINAQCRLLGKSKKAVMDNFWKFIVKHCLCENLFSISVGSVEKVRSDDQGQYQVLREK